MKGIIFNLFEDVVRRAYGDDAWDDLLEAARVDGIYTSVGSYPDSDLLKLVAAMGSARELDDDAVLRWFGRQAVPTLAERYPHFFAPYGSLRAFLLALNDIIHPEVRKIYPGAEVPQFDYLNLSSQRELRMSYRSKRRLCALAEGLISGSAEMYGQKLAVQQVRCAQRGNDACEFRITFHAS